MFQVLRAEAKRTAKLVNLLVDRSAHEADERVELLGRIRSRFDWIEDEKERLLFPLLEATPVAELVQQLRAAREVVIRELDQLTSLPSDNEHFSVQARVVAQRLEELWARDRRELFPRARRVVPKEQVDALGIRIAGEQRSPDGARRPELR